MHFTKMHGLGNDYLYVYGEVPDNIAELSKRLSERHFGAGSDGMIYISPSAVADFRMRIFNADGSEAKMCGNGIRCVGKYVYDKGYTDKTTLTVETLSGIKTLALDVCCGKVTGVSVDMGAALAAEDMTLCMDGETVTLTPVSVGNPHAVIFVSDIERAPLTTLGPKIEHHKAFDDGVNVEFVQVLGDGELRMRVWERGSGVTMACGTGAC
ncbi:MAG: diaminopimelate epimerase, partial [Clostridia bacterium]|nr:diaminopimelate epimerase [Clostridia bacterium]